VYPIIYAVDIGSIAQGNFGWARIDPTQDDASVDRGDGTEICALIDALTPGLHAERRGVALGFDCPLFVPIPVDPYRLGKARAGERDRPWRQLPERAHWPQAWSKQLGYSENFANVARQRMSTSIGTASTQLRMASFCGRRWRVPGRREERWSQSVLLCRRR
jgi:hypothetical protein